VASVPTSTTISLPAEAKVTIWDETDTIITAVVKDSDGDGTAQDLTDAEVICIAKVPLADDEAAELDVTVADEPTTGEISIALPADTFAPGAYEAQVTVIFPADHAAYPDATMAAQVIELTVRRQIAVPAEEA